MFHKVTNKRECIPMSQSGFTLIELMVSLAIFSIVMVISTGTLLVMVDMNAKAQALYSANTNLSFAIDSMSRDIRTGYHHYCKRSNGNAGERPYRGASRDNGDCSGSDKNYIALTREVDKKRVAYRLNGTKLEYTDESLSGWLPITSDDIVIESFTVRVQHSDPLGSYNGSGVYTVGSDVEQPVVDLLIKGRVTNGLETDTTFALQSHIVQRRLDLE